ncbi:MAG: hypothetical protein H7Y11_05685, partial [Armatimonadetes bacterium]|nr:hypothetical protein [Anaerolineae bacterium]
MLRATPRLLIFVLMVVLLIVRRPDMMLDAEPTSQSDADAVERVTLALTALQEWYNPETGLWESTNWWNAANALYTVIDYSKRTGDTQYQT